MTQPSMERLRLAAADRVLRNPSWTCLRFRSCPTCGGRRRTLVDTGVDLRGRCLDCGSDLGRPLATEGVAQPPTPRLSEIDAAWAR
jgi:uncharacterized protein (DUF983 family)